MKNQKAFINNWKLISILIFALVVRFWRIQELTTFSGDQGIDFLIVKRMLMDGELTLLGPKLGHFSDIANLYLGPAYYYLISFPLYISAFDPLGPILFIAALSFITIILVFIFVKNYFNTQIALISSGLIAFSSPIIEQSRVPLNPNLIPFFSTLLLLSLFRIIFDKRNNILWPVIFGMASGVLIQLHYLTVSIIVISYIALLINKHYRSTVIAAVLSIMALMPQIFFELRHNFFITNQFILRLSGGDNIFSLSSFLGNINNSFQILTTTISSAGYNLPSIISFIAIIILIKIIPPIYKSKFNLIIIIIFSSIILNSFTNFSPQFHYFSHVYILFIILMSIFIHLSLKSIISPIFKFIIIIVLATIIAANLSSLELSRVEGYTMPKGWNLTGVKKASRIISKDVDHSTKFNIASTIDGDTRARPFRYFVEVYGKTPQSVEEYPKAEILYLISRDSHKEILEYSVWEVSSIKPFVFDSEWIIQNGIKLYKLTKEKQT